MNRWKIAFWCCLIIMLLTTGTSFYFIIDQGVSLTYMKDGYSNTENDLDEVIEIFNKTDLTKYEIEAILTNHRFYEFMDFENDTVSLERVLLIFKNDSLIEIEKRW